MNDNSSHELRSVLRAMRRVERLRMMRKLIREPQSNRQESAQTPRTSLSGIRVGGAPMMQPKSQLFTERNFMRGLVVVLCLAFLIAVGRNFVGDEGLFARLGQDSAEPTVEALAPLPGAAPSFDVVRVEPGGDAILAGRAEPGSEVVVLLDGKEVGKADVDSRGEWLLLPSEQLAVGSHRLDLEARREGYSPRSSEDLIVIEVPEGRPANESQVFLLGREAGAEPRVLQGNPIGGLTVGALRLETVDYDSRGFATIRGRAPAGGKIFAKLGDIVLGETFVAANGVWKLSPREAIDEGQHNLVVELRNTNDQVLWKLKAPLTRHGQSFITDHSGVQGTDEHGRIVGVNKFIRVETGNSLWVIARRELGSGFLYSVIYDQNRDQISNPDLIFPGQVFEVPIGGTR